MNDMTDLLQALALQESTRKIGSFLFPARSERLQEQALRLDIFAKKRMLGMPLSDEDLESGGTDLPRTAPFLHSSFARKRQVTGPRPRSLATLIGTTSEQSFLKRGISNASRSVTRRLFG